MLRTQSTCQYVAAKSTHFWLPSLRARTVKVSIHTRIGLSKDADKIIAMDNSLLAVRDINHKYIVVATCKEKAVCAICGIHYG